tara:strand:- start:285 stop:896 length:612 start_codon:yes stop_codon:yes gene_type:complete
MDQNILFLFLLSSMSLTIFPGPDLMYVISTSLSQGWRKGLILSLGLCSGLIVHTLVVIFGLGTILEDNPETARIIELFGALYLLFIAYRLLRNNRNKKLTSSKKKFSENVFLTGFLMNLTNPKVSLFFISFFPGFLFSKVLSYKLQFLILGIIFFIQALIIFSFITFVVNRLGENVKFYKNQSSWNKIQAAVLFFISIILIYP